MDSPCVMAYFIDGETPLLSRRPQYPATLCRLEYLAEGGANIVYQISIPNKEHTVPTKLNRKLLRLRKNVKHSQTAADQLAAFNKHFKPLFAAQHLVQHDLIRLDDGIVAALNDLLRKRVRPSHRAQDFLAADEANGMLITDMTPRTGEQLLQIKPKWLLQSPSAPRNSRRCRTCALRAQRKAQKKATMTDEMGGCPLLLVGSGAASRRKAASRITDDPRLAFFLADEIQADVLGILKDQQGKLDPQGALNVREVSAMFDLCKAMTLRDCTLFIKRSRTTIEGRLGDLDFKPPEKLPVWKRVESSLIEEGWYTNSEATQFHTTEEVCLLSAVD